MSSAGHVLDSINRIRQNRALKQAKRDRYNKMMDKYHELDLIHEKEFHDKNRLSEEQMKEYKAKIKEKFARQRRIQAVVMGIISVVLIAVIWYFISK